MSDIEYAKKVAPDALAFKDMLIESSKFFIHPHIEGVFAVFLGELPDREAEEPFTYVTLLDGKVQRQGSEAHCREWEDAWNASESSVQEVGRATVEGLFRRGRVVNVETRAEAIKRMHDIMATVPSHTLYSLAEALYEAGIGLEVTP